MNVCLLIGMLLNITLIVVNRFVHKLPNRVQLPLVIFGIVLLVIGLIQLGIVR